MRYELIECDGRSVRHWDGDVIPDDVCQYPNRNAAAPYRLRVDGAAPVVVQVTDPLGQALEQQFGLKRDWS